MKKKTLLRKLEKSSAKELQKRAGMALKNKYYLEASWILSVLFERRVKRLIRKLEGNQKTVGITFEQSIKRIKHLHLSGNHHDFSETFSIELIDRLRQWKNQRNLILKDMLAVHVSQARMERLARDGFRLSQIWNKALRSYKKSRNSRTGKVPVPKQSGEI